MKAQQKIYGIEINKHGRDVKVKNRKGREITIKGVNNMFMLTSKMEELSALLDQPMPPKKIELSLLG